jgi:hypothetical protein
MQVGIGPAVEGTAGIYCTLLVPEEFAGFPFKDHQMKIRCRIIIYRKCYS